MKILVPTDFSKASNNAALYAAKFAEKVNAEIILFHVVHFEHPPMVQVFGFIEHEIESIRTTDASEACAHLVEELKSNVKSVPISFKIVTGFPIESEIENYAVANNIDLIIMGSKGAGDVQSLLFGSTALGVIHKSSLPVIAVPESASFKGIKVIVSASNMHKIQPEIQKIIPIAKLFDASIDVLHVISPEHKGSDPAMAKNDLSKKYNYQKISFHIAYNHDIIDGINQYVAAAKADILAMYTHETGFFESFFKKDLVKEEAIHSSLPLLTLRM